MSEKTTVCILLIEDNPGDVKIFHRYAAASKQYCIKVDYVTTLEETLQRLSAREYDLIFLDQRLGESVTGLDTFKRIKAHAIDIPIITLTGSGNEETAVEMMKSGATDYLLKDKFNAEVLERSIRYALEQYRLSVERKQAESQRDATLEMLKKANKELATREKAVTNMLYDLTESHEELKKTQGQLIQSAKLASLGELAAGVAHEINNPTGFIGNNLTSLDKYIANLSEIVGTAITLKDAVTIKNMEGAAKTAERITELEKKLDIHYIMEDSANLLKESQEGIERIATIVADLNVFSHTDKKMDTPCNLNEILDQTLNIVWNELKHKAKVKKSYGDLPTVKGNLQQLEQVFLNLLLNASQAIGEKGVIAIRTYVKDTKGYVEISDTGKGIPPEAIDKIFDPFFTTKETGKGTGLGLSISYSIIKNHNGAIYVESAPGKGTKFTVCLPSAGGPAPRRSPATTQ